MNNKKKKRQSSLYKMKAIQEHIKQSLQGEIRQSYTKIYADNQIYQIFKAPNNIHYGYKVINYMYCVRVEDINPVMIKGRYLPIYHKSKAIKC